MARAFRSTDFVSILVIGMAAGILGGCGGSGNITDPIVDPVNEWLDWTDTTVVSDTTIPAGRYRVNGNIEVGGGTLTLSPGVTLAFGAGYGLRVGEGGGIRAVGTAGAPITLTGQSKTRGYWYGLTLARSNRADNELRYVVIEYGGTDNPNEPANLGLWDGARLRISHCTLRESATYGFYLRDPGPVEWSENVVTRNALGAGSLAAPYVDYLDAASTYSGNDVDRVMVRGDSSSTTDQTWPAIDVDYFLNGVITVDSHVTLSAGASLVFDEEAALDVTSSGALTASGTPAAPILLVGVEEYPGSWYGVSFTNCGSPYNILSHVVVAHAGRELPNGTQAGVRLFDGSRLLLEDCTIRDSAGWGLWMRDSDLENAGTNAYENNASGDMYEEI